MQLLTLNWSQYLVTIPKTLGPKNYAKSTLPLQMEQQSLDDTTSVYNMV